MAETLDIFKKQLYNFTQKAKQKANKLVGTEMEVDPEIPIESVQSIDESEMIKHAVEIKQQMKEKIQEEKIPPKLSAYDKEIAPYYVGCYSDDPTNLSMKEYLGVVSNPVECMKLGKKHGFDYIGIQQGDKCYGSKELPKTSKVDEKHCGIHCNQPGAGTCGGYFYNKVYNTNAIQIEGKPTLKSEKIVAPKLVESFNKTNTDVNNISRNLGGLKYIDENSSICPINQYILGLSVVIILIVLYLVIDKMN